MGQLEDMSTFIRIVEAGSISSAAEQLGLVKSAVSRRLSDLENRLGIQLINRTTRRSSLTEEGEHYYRRALKIVDDVDELHSSATDTRMKLRGALKLSLPLSFGLRHMTEALNLFKIDHPDLTLSLDFSDRQVDLVEDGFDLAIRIADLPDSTLIARRLSVAKFVLCASPEYLEKVGHPNIPKDLKTHKILAYLNSRDRTWLFVDTNGSETRINVSADIYANNGDYLYDAAIAGLGVARIPTFIAWKGLRQGQLIQVLPNFSLSEFNVYAVYPKTRHRTQRVSRLVDFLIARFSGVPYWDKF